MQSAMRRRLQTSWKLMRRGKAKSLIGLAESHSVKLEKALAEIGKVFREPGIELVAAENKGALSAIEKELRELQAPSPVPPTLPIGG